MRYTTQHAVQYDNGAPFRPYVASAICQCHPGRRSLFVVYAGGRGIDWPIKVGERILYDWPERVPAIAKRLVEEVLAPCRAA